jgi:diguanylate cyclase (GGDEF)-like protein/PAS domain S-box-containing protein
MSPACDVLRSQGIMLRGIRARLLGLVIVTLVPFMALTGGGLWIQWQNDRDQAYNDAQVEARLLAAAVDDQLGNIENFLAGLSRAVSTDPANVAANDATLRTIKSELPIYVGNILLFDLNGDKIGTSSDATGGPTVSGDRNSFLDVIRGRRFAIGEPAFERATGDWLVSIARPVENHGRLAAVLTVGIKLERFEQALRAHPLPAGIVVEIVNEHGAVIGRNPNVTTEGAARPAENHPRNWSGLWSGNVERITSSAVVNRAPWRVSASFPTDVALANVMSRLLWGSIAGATALVVAVALASVFAGRIIRPLRELGEDASALAGGNFAHRTSLRSTGEVGALASTFNSMAASLEERHRELVTARTAATAEAAERARFADMERQAKDTLAAVIDTSPVAIVCSNLDRRVVIWNQSAERIFGYLADEIIGQPIDLVWPGGAEQSLQLFERAIAGQNIRGVELVGRRKTGSVDLRVAATAMHRDGAAWGVAWAFDDITDRKSAEARLKRSAHYDPLTGLPNRRAMRDELEAILEGDRAHAVVLVDLDGFKDVNDSAGHSSGDQLLIEVARRLIRVCEARGKAFRLGGDEFVVIMEGCGDPRTVAERVEAILRELSQPYDLNEHVHLIGASAGIAVAPNDGNSVDELIVNADLALYQVKSDGGHAYRFFVPAFRAQAHARRGLRQELRRAFAENEFELYYQPQIRLADGAVVGAEALLRWRHPVQGLVGPSSFIDALSESAMAPEIGRWILREACQKAAGWRAVGKLTRIGVNLFPIQSRDSTLFADVEDALQSSGLPAESLELEVTENAALDKDSAIIQFQRLHARGVSLAFDDFGTGYASLSYLTRFPISRIKIDCSFVARITEHAEDNAIVRSLIAMAHNLGLVITAEGVETAEQAAFLRAEQCEEAQGFFYAKPLSAAEFQTYLHSTKSALETDRDKAAFRQRHRRAAEAG